ncbi:hypothetical protein [Anaeromyxobacter sp. SG64]|uniref:hypothetical protein n=1 Tax=Anaeromyxobacter sp. SG64 TaxID=2925409 RepID=UPI001F57F92D|nr:hypothetical protein [Anaeromyxobacter sp. SG64]
MLHALYRLANYRPGRLASGAVVEVGQVACSLSRIAQEAGTSIKVVRTTLRRLAAGSDRDGLGPLAVVPEGTDAGTRTRLITLLHYPRSRLTCDATGTAAGTEAGTEAGTIRARSGHDRGTDRKKGKNERKGSPLLAFGSEGDAATKNTDPPSDGAHALTETLAATFLAMRGVPYGHNGGRDARAVADLLRLSRGDIAEVERRWQRALTLGTRWPGCSTIAHLRDRWNDLAGAGAPPGRGVTSTGKPRVIADVTNFDDPKVKEWTPT